MQSFNLFTPIFIGLGSALGILLGLWLSRPKKNQVFKVLPGDQRGFDLEVLNETSLSLDCENYKGLPPQRFLKFRPGFTVLQKMRWGRTRKIMRHIGRDGTAYTQRSEQGNIENVPLSQTLKVLWGDENYNKMSDELRDPIESGKIGVTIQLEDDPLTPKNLPILSEENIKQWEDSQASKTLWEGRKDVMKSIGIQMMFPVGLGVAIGLVMALFLGWIPVATPNG